MPLSPEQAALLGALQYFPVRHHSPRTSLVLARWLERLQPALVLVEGPCDADALIDVLLDSGTQPPVALLGYRTDGTSQSTLYPFAAYSPEYVAMQWARRNGKRTAFIDLTIGESLAHDAAERSAREAENSRGDPEPGDATHEVDGSDDDDVAFDEAIAAATGHRTFEESWEASFEAPAHAADGFREALLAYAELVRNRGDRRDFHRARDAYMLERITAQVGGLDPSRVAVVAGAAHVAAFVAGDVEPERRELLRPTVPTAVTLIPYSFTRLAGQTGYGAGNRAPRYYQRAFDAQGDFDRASIEVFLDFAAHLRLRGFGISLADVIEAYRLARTLANIREKAAPGLDEVREAAIATLCRGDATHVDGFLWPSVVGHAVGKVASRVGRNSLQEEFWGEVERRRLPRSDQPERFVLRLNDPVQVETSVFLHRLRIADVPYAGFQGTRTQAAGGAAEDEAAGGVSALTRAREGWEAQWTPSTDVALVERIVLGDTLTQVCGRRLTERLAAADRTGAAAEILLEAVVTDVPEVQARALESCEALAAHDDHVPSLSVACRALSGLVSFGTSRRKGTGGDDAIAALLVRTFERACLRIGAACRGDEEAVRPVRAALRVLHELALGSKFVPAEDWYDAAHALVADAAVHPSCAGLASGLLYLAQRIGDEEVTQLVRQRLASAHDPRAASEFLAGFLEVNALALVRNRAVVRVLDGFLCAIPVDRFRDALPPLRRAFAALGPTERRYLLENLVAVRNIGSRAPEVAATMKETDKEKLKAMSAELSSVLDDLDDLL